MLFKNLVLPLLLLFVGIHFAIELPVVGLVMGVCGFLSAVLYRKIPECADAFVGPYVAVSVMVSFYSLAFLLLVGSSGTPVHI